MRKLFTSVACVGLLLALTASAGFAANLLTNPGFETGDLTGWQVFGISANSNVTVGSPDNGPSFPGTHHAFMNNRAEAMGLTLKQTTPPGSATAGTVNYSFDIKLSSAANGGVFFVQIFAERSGVGIVGGSGLLGNYAPANWTTYSGSFTAPAGTDFLTIQFMANTGAVIGSVSTMLVDNVNLDQGGVVATESSTWGNIKGLYR
jgi:hypothetical protein